MQEIWNNQGWSDKAEQSWGKGLVSNFTKSSTGLISEVLSPDEGTFHRVKHQSELNGKEARQNHLHGQRDATL